MRRRGYFLTLVLLLSLVPVVSSLSWAYPLRLKDDTGATIELAKRPARIISLTPSATEILFALGLEAEIVGVTNYCDFPEQAKTKEKIGDLNLNYEKILSLDPDLIVAVGNMPSQAVVNLRRLGLAVLHLMPVDLDSTMASIDKVGEAVGDQMIARKVISEMRREIEAVENHLGQSEEAAKPSVFVEIWMDPIMTAGPGTFTAELIRRAGGRDIAYDAKPWSPFSEELILTRNPEVIISQCEGAEGILKRPGWERVDAVASGRVYDVDQNIFSRPGPRLVEALAVLAKLLHPEIFALPGY